MIEDCWQMLWTLDWSDIIWAHSVCPSGFENISADDKHVTVIVILALFKGLKCVTYA